MNKLEIFKPGRHTAMSGAVINFTEADLKATAEAYDPKLYEAPLVVGHPKLDAPAYGWVKSLAYSGTLNAGPDQVDPEFAEMVNAGRFKKISASFFAPAAPGNPKPGVYYLRHVGFLGATPPSVKGLKNASFADSEEGVIEFSEDVDAGVVSRLFRSLRELVISKFGTEDADRAVPDWLIESIKMPEAVRAAYAEGDTETAVKWLKAAIKLHEDHMAGKAPTTGPAGEKSQQKMMDQMQRALAALTGEAKQTMDMSEPNQEITMKPEEIVAKEADVKKREAAIDTKEASFAEREQKIALAEAKARRTEVTGYVEGLVKAGRLLPRDQAPLVEFMAALDEAAVIEFAEGNETKKEPRGKWLREFLGRLPQQVDYAERTKAGEGDDKTVSFAAPHGYSVDPARLEMHNKALAYQASHPNTSYDAALAAVSK